MSFFTIGDNQAGLLNERDATEAALSGPSPMFADVHGISGTPGDGPGRRFLRWLLRGFRSFLLFPAVVAEFFLDHSFTSFFIRIFIICFKLFR